MSPVHLWPLHTPACAHQAQLHTQEGWLEAAWLRTSYRMLGAVTLFSTPLAVFSTTYNQEHPGCSTQPAHLRWDDIHLSLPGGSLRRRLINRNWLSSFQSAKLLSTLPKPSPHPSTSLSGWVVAACGATVLHCYSMKSGLLLDSASSYLLSPCQVLG